MIWLGSCGSGYTSQSFSDTTLCAYCKDKQENKDLHTPTPMLPMMILLVLKIAKPSQSASCGPVCTLLFGTQLHMTTTHDNKTYMAYDNTTGTPNDDFIYYLEKRTCSLWLGILPVHKAPIYSINQVHFDNKTHFAYDYTILQNMALHTANNALLYKNKVG